jgi:PAS domain S-box-containing protein
MTYFATLTFGLAAVADLDSRPHAIWTFALTDSATNELLGTTSLALQVVVACYALWLNRVFGTRRAGWALSGAFVLMLAMHLNELASPPVSVVALGCPPSLAYSFISLLLLLGLSHLATLYRERQKAEDIIRQARDELEVRVAERTAELVQANTSLAQEIDQRKQAEAQIRASQEMYRGLVDSLEGIIFECKAEDLSFTFVSPQCERLLGYGPDQWLKEIRWQDIIYPHDYRTFTQNCAKSLPDKSSASLEYRVVAQGKRIRWVRQVSNFVTSAQGELRLRGVLLDITERKQLEDELRQAQKMEAVGKLAGGVAHDFRNILTVIHGYGELLLAMQEAGGDATEYLRQICEAANRGNQLTRQLLAFSRKQDIRIELVDLNAVVESTTKMLGVLLGEDVALGKELARPLPPIQADAGQLTQVLMNLAVNARDAMPIGGRLTIKTAEVGFTEQDKAVDADVRPGKFACLSVADTGTGIPPEVLPHIFEPFFTTKDIGKGTGLGLSTVYGIIQQHGGWIKVETALNQGTTLHLYLPATEAQPKSFLEPSVASSRTGHSETILLVEDDALVLEMAAAALEGQSYRVLRAGSGPAALRLWTEHLGRVDLLLTDIVMPEGMSGWDVIKRLRAENPRLKTIATSGYAPEAPHGLDVAMLPKPYRATTLLKTVGDVLDGRQPVCDH